MWDLALRRETSWKSQKKRHPKLAYQANGQPAACCLEWHPQDIMHQFCQGTDCMGTSPLPLSLLSFLFLLRPPGNARANIHVHTCRVVIHFHQLSFHANTLYHHAPSKRWECAGTASSFHYTTKSTDYILQVAFCNHVKSKVLESRSILSEQRWKTIQCSLEFNMFP